MSQHYKVSTSVTALRESDPYLEQFSTEKSKYTALVGFTVICSYRISLGDAKDEGLKELWRGLSLKKANFFESVRHKLLYLPYR